MLINPIHSPFTVQYDEKKNLVAIYWIEAASIANLSPSQSMEFINGLGKINTFVDDDKYFDAFDSLCRMYFPSMGIRH